MAKITISAALGNLGNVGDFLAANLNVTAFGPTSLTLKDAQGDGFTLTGTGLTYDLSGVTGGTFTGLRIFTSADVTLETVTNFSAPAQALYTIYKFGGGIGSALLDIFSHDDSMTGSAVADMLFTYAGNDTVHGGGGNDIIGGSVGRDKLYGEKGADVFLFVKGDGKDHIMDFTDVGGANDDRIGITQKYYNTMTIEETASGVTLHFGAKNAIMVDHWHAADVGVDDFLFG